MRINAFLADQNVPFEPVPHPPAYSAQKRAKYLHISGSRVAKSVLLYGPQGFLLAVLPATHQIDTDELARDLAGPVRLATAAEIADFFSDCEWGVVPPFGALYGLKTVVDDSLAPDAELVFEGHTHFEAVRMRCADFERLEGSRRLRFARRPDAFANPSD
jgi:Ala-tRNA(Pro) deacylase